MCFTCLCSTRCNISRNRCGEFANVVAFVSIFCNLNAVTQRDHAFAESAHLFAEVIEVVLAGYLLASRFKDAREEVADKCTARITDRQWACRICGDEFHIDLQPRPDVGAAKLRALHQRRPHQPMPQRRRQPQVQEPRSGHIRASDVPELHALMQAWPEREFNIEGNPFHNLMEHVRAVRPHQVTFVPDSEGQFTSDHGWTFPQDAERLKPLIDECKALGVRVSLFMDPIPEQMAAARAVGADRVELYTEPYAAAWGHVTQVEQLERYRAAAQAALDAGLGINAGHDLNRDNLADFLRGVPGVAEVASIGGFVRQYSVTVDPGRLRQYGVPLSRISEVIAASNRDVGGRAIELAETDYDVTFAGGFEIPGKLLRIDIDADQTVRNYPPHVALVADSRNAAQALLGALSRQALAEPRDVAAFFVLGAGALGCVRRRASLVPRRGPAL